MLVIPEQFVRGPPITHGETGAPPPELVELVGQRPAGLFSSQSFQMVPNGVRDRFGLRLAGQPRQFTGQLLCFSVSDVERHNDMYSMTATRVANT